MTDPTLQRFPAHSPESRLSYSKHILSNYHLLCPYLSLGLLLICLTIVLQIEGNVPFFEEKKS